MERTEIDIETWDRKVQFNFFKRFTKPFWSVTTTIDVDSLVNYCKETKTSFYGAMSYVILYSCNTVQNFRLRCEEGKVYDYKQINAQFTALQNTGNTDITRRVHFNPNFNVFIREFVELKKETEECRIPPHPREMHDNVVFLSCLPWFRFSNFESIMNYNGNDYVPRITWGKYEKNNGRYEIDLSIEVNHAFVDGYHISQFLKEIENQINELTKNKNYN